MDLKGGKLSSLMTPEERRNWVEKHDEDYRQQYVKSRIYGDKVYKIRDQVPDTYGRDNTVACRTHAVDKHGWGYRREIKWGQ